MVGVDAKGQTIDGDIELGLILLGQLVLHLSDGVVGKESVHGHLIVPGLVHGVVEYPTHQTT